MPLDTQYASKSIEWLITFTKSEDFATLKKQVEENAKPASAPSSDVYFMAQSLDQILTSLIEALSKEQNAIVAEELNHQFVEARRNYERVLHEAREDLAVLVGHNHFNSVHTSQSLRTRDFHA